MIMTTPNEFLEFAKEMGLGRIKSTSSSSSSPSRSLSNNNSYTTGLCVLNNLCCLIEQIHQLKAENDRLRAQIELDDHVDKFQQRFLLKDNQKKKKEKHKQIISSTNVHHEQKSQTLSPTNSLESKHSKSNREQKGSNYGSHQEDSPSTLQIDHEQSELIDSNSGLSNVPTWNNWSKVRHALKFSLRRKHDYSTSPPFSHVDRQIPTISVSIESDDDHLQDNKRLTKKKKKKIITANENQQMIIGEDTDQDDAATQFVKAYHKRRLYENDTPNSSSTERQEASSTNIRSNIDDETLFARKQSKIASYRRKLRSKLDTVKRQFSDQNGSSSMRLFHNSHGLTLDDIGSGINHALLTAQLAPALTKSYQQKMREWETMQKSHFLVNYRRQSITPKIDFNSNSRKASIVSIINETSTDLLMPALTIDDCSSRISESNLELETNLTALGPILSPNQRSLIVHQWREIMSEEISLRHCNEYLEKKIILLKQLETNLKSLKTNIFCTNNSIKQRSMINIRESYQYEQSYLPQRCRSLQTLISMPASWILAVQSAAYSDVLDGTSNKTTERAILFNKDFFDQLEQLKRDRRKFEQDSIKDLQSLSRSKTNQKRISNDNRIHVKSAPVRGHLRKLTLIESYEFPEHFLPYPTIPLQTTISQPQPSSNIEYLPTTLTNEIDSNIKVSLLPSHLNKRPKRSRFDFKETYHRSRSMCVAQINSWLQRRRQQHVSLKRRNSATESKISTPCTTPKLLGSPRLSRFRRRIFKQQPSTSQQADRTPIPVQILDDSDNRSQSDVPVRIYFPPLTAPIARHVRMTDDINIIPSYNDDQDIQIEQTSDLTANRTYSSSSSSSLKISSAKERRESYITLSNIFNNKCI